MTEVKTALLELGIALKELAMLPMTHPKGVAFITAPFWLYYIFTLIKG